MTSIRESARRYRLFILVAVLVGIAASGAQLARMPVNLLPNISPTIVEVQTEALGLSAQEVEAMITVPLEADMLNGIPWLDRIESRSITGLSSIEMTFAPGTDLMHARQMVQEKLTAAHALPNVSKPPVMRQPVATDARVVQIGLTSEALSLIDLSVLARWTIRPRLLGLSGVANIAIWGERQRQMQVVADPDLLARGAVPLEDVIRTSGNALWVSPLSYLNASTPGTGGFIDTPNQRLAIQHVFPIVAPADMAGLPLDSESGKTLGDIATVVEGHQPLIGDALINGRPGLLLVVEKFPWANTATVVHEVETALAGLAPGLPGVTVETGSLQAGALAEEAARTTRRAAMLGAALAVLLMLAALRDWRAVALAAAVAGTTVMVAGGVVVGLAATVNAALLSGLFAAAALVLCNALQAVRDRSEAAPGRIALATLAAMLVAAPLLALPGIGGSVAAAATWPYLIAAALSLAAALLLLPALETGLRHAEALRPKRTGRRPAALRRAPALALCSVVIVAGLGLVATRGLAPAPDFRHRDLLVRWTSPPGSSLESVKERGEALSEGLRKSGLVRASAMQVGRAEISDEVLNANAGTLWLSLAPDVDARDAEVRIRELAAAAGLQAGVTSYQNRQIARAAPRDAATDLLVRVYGHDYDTLGTLAENIAARLARVGGVNAAEIHVPDREQVIEIEVDLERAKALRTKPGDVRRAISALVAGIQVGSFFEDQKVFDVVVWGDARQRSSLEALRVAKIDVPGGSVPLSDIAEVRVAETPSFINRAAVSRFIEIAVSAPNAGRALARRIESELVETDFPREYHAELVGGRALRDANSGLPFWQAALAALIGIVLLMQAGLGSWHRALAATAHALAVGGVAVMVAVLLGAWSATAALGVAAAIGIALRDAIASLADGAATERRAPSVTGHAAAVMALVPALLFFGPGLDFVWPMAIALIAGLAASALLTLFVLPELGRAAEHAFRPRGGKGVAHA